MNEVTTTGPTEIESSGPLTVEQAFDKIRKPKEQPKAKPEPKEPEPVKDADAPDLHSADVESEQIIRAGIEAVTILDQRIEAAEKQLAELEQQGETVKATSLQLDVKKAKEERAKYQQAVEFEKQQLGNRLLSRAVKAGEKKIAKAFPDGVDNKALREYLSTGDVQFSAAEINQAYDYRLVILAEKARRYDEAQSKVKKVPKYRKSDKPKQEAPQEDPEVKAALDRINRQGLNRQDATTIMRAKPKPKEPATVTQLRKRLHKSGSLDDAYELLQASKRAAR